MAAYTVSLLGGLSTRIYQTVHDGALAFLVVVSSFGKLAEKDAAKVRQAKAKGCAAEHPEN